MEIKYLKKLNALPGFGLDKFKGMTEKEIAEVEKKRHIAFPQAYREYLHIAGVYGAGIDFMPGASTQDLLKDDFQDSLKKVLDEGYVAIEKPFWVFEEMDDFQQFGFFYLDGDDNPRVYFVSYDVKYNGYIRDSGKSFSAYIDAVIIDTHNLLKRGY